jgi:hypothetical protein
MAVIIPIPKYVSETIAERAYGLWLARGFRNGSPEEDLLRAVELTLRKGRVARHVVPFPRHRKNGHRVTSYCQEKRQS